MSSDAPINQFLPTARPDVSRIVKEQSALWKAAAAANHWAVLEIPERAQMRDDKRRYAASADAAQSRRSKAD